MEPNVFMGYLTNGIANVLNSFGHEQYPSNNIYRWCLIIEYPNVGIGFLLVLVGLHNIHDAKCHARISKHICDQGMYIYFGHKDKMYVISKQLIVNVF